jgi:choline dehydrogenase
MHDAWKTVPGVEFPKDGSEGRAGIVWIPSSVDPRDETRSYARTGYYEPIKARTNYVLLTGHKVAKINFAPDNTPLTAESVFIIPRAEDGPGVKVTANKEVILAAGAIHTPQILQLSGVGPRYILDKANISVVHDLPGVGQNFHDHSWLSMEYKCMKYLNTLLEDG